MPSFHHSRIRAAALLCILPWLTLSSAWAVLHNPTDQSNDPKKDTEVSITSATATLAEGAYTITVEIDGGDYPELLGDSSHGQIQVVGEDDTAVDVTSTTATLTVDQSDCGCEIQVQLIGFTGGDGLPFDVEMPSGDGPENGSVKFHYSLGYSEKNHSAGFLSAYGRKPSTGLYSPLSLKSVIGASGVERITLPWNPADPQSPDYIRQVRSGSQLTDIVPLTAESYRMRFFHASQAGSKVDGLYQPTGNPYKTVTIENPGAIPIANTDDDPLFHHSRWGDSAPDATSFSYAIPVADNHYRVDLHFTELYHGQAGESLMRVGAEGEVVLDDFDIFSASGGLAQALIQPVTTTVGDGELNLDFQSLEYGAQVSALKVVRDGEVAVSGTPDDELFHTERTGDFSWQTSLANGNYSVTLFFAETVYQNAESRVFNVSAQGAAVLSDFDIFDAAGHAQAHAESFPVTVADGNLTLAFTGTTGAAKLNAILIKDDLGAFVQAVNAGGGAFVADDSTAFAADSGFTGGEMDFPGRVVIAINCGGEEHVAADSTVFLADSDEYHTGGRSYSGAFNRLRLTEEENGGDPLQYDYTWLMDPKSNRFGETILSHANGAKLEGKEVVWSADRLSYTEIRTWRNAQGILASRTDTRYEQMGFGFAKVSETVDPDGPT